MGRRGRCRRCGLNSYILLRCGLGCSDAVAKIPRTATSPPPKKGLGQPERRVFSAFESEVWTDLGYTVVESGIIADFWTATDTRWAMRCPHECGQIVTIEPECLRPEVDEAVRLGLHAVCVCGCDEDATAVA